MSPALRAAIFDVDGTLVDSVDSHAEAWQRIFERYGRSVPFAEVRAQIGKGGDQILPLFFSPEELQRLDHRLEEDRRKLYVREYLPRVRAFPGVRDLFLRVRGAGLKIALASSAHEDELRAYKRIARIVDLVDDVTSRDDAQHSKPEPDIFLAALHRLGDLPAAEAMAVGDSPWDALGAGRAHVRTLGFLSGGFAERDLREAGCLAIYRGPLDLCDRFDASPLAGRPAPARPEAPPASVR